MIRYIIGTTCFWLLLFGYGALYALFNGWEVRGPAATPQDAAIESVFDVTDNTPMPLTKHKKH